MHIKHVYWDNGSQLFLRFLTSTSIYSENEFWATCHNISILSDGCWHALLRTHSSRVIVAGWDGNDMFACEKIKHVWCKYQFRWQRDVSGVRDLSCWQLFWGVRMGVWECSGTMWCYASIESICRDLNQCQLCTFWARKERWLTFYP